MWSLLNNVFTYGNEGGKVFVYRGGHPWDVVRNNQGIDAFLHALDYDIMVKCDVDQWYPENYFLDMVPLVKDYPVIGPVIYDRQQRTSFAPLVVDEPFGKFIPIDGHSGIHKFPYTHTNNFYARVALEQVAPPWYEAHLSEDGLSRANHVDYDFLDKIRDAGYDIYTNCDITVEHITKVRVSKEFHRKQRGDHGRVKRFL
jgi:hypothetical protein